MSLESFVKNSIMKYQGDRAVLAKLRTGAGRDVLHSQPMLVLYTKAPEWEGPLGRSLNESAHAALTLFALRSSGSSGSTAHDETRFGKSLRKVSAARGSSSATDRSIRELTTATTMSEFLNHLRRAVSLMGQSGVGTDFVSLASDIHNFGRGGDHRRRVLVRWASDYHTIDNKEGKAS